MNDMKAKIHVQIPEANAASCLFDRLASLIAEGRFNEARIVSAYVTVSGVRRLLDAFEKSPLIKSLWLLGLDDVVTQPGAVKLLMSMKNSEVRVASLEHQGARFHPKFFAFRKSGKSHKGLVMIGSANLTAAGLSKNAEAVAFLQSNSASDVKDIDASWRQLWRLGVRPDDQLLAEYAEKHKKASSVRRKKREGNEKRPHKNRRQTEVLFHDTAEIDPSLADTCWIECGYITALGRELEFKAEQSIFFGLDSKGGAFKDIDFKVSNRDIVSLRIKYQENSMWRLQMNKKVPEVRAGLRKKRNGKLQRSPFVAVFRRIKRPDEPDLYGLSFIRLGSKEFKTLKKKTEEKGTLGRTRARSYGWL